MAFDAAERNGRVGRIQCQRGKESSNRGKRKRRVFFCRRTVRVKVQNKSIPASFLKIEERGTLIGAIELVGGQNPAPEASSRGQEKSREEGAKKISGEEQWKRVGMSKSLRGRRLEEVIQSNTSYPRGSEVPLESQRG